MKNAAPYLRLLNPKRKWCGFHLFPQLPLEIRLMIWQQALCHERLVFVHLVNRGEQSKKYYYGLNPWANGPVTDDYVIFVSQPSTISKLFRVNAEARSCASRFYRVQLPCTYHCGDHVEENGTLYINPELDALAISCFEHFVKFAHDIWAHDPSHVGLLNMAMERQLFHFMYTHEKNQNHLREVISRLRRVWFMFMQKESDEFRRVNFPGTNDTIPKFKPLFSRPIMAAYGGPRAEIINRRKAKRYIEEEARQWQERLRRPRKKDKVWQPEWLSTIDKTCQDADQIPRPAMGFWLFPRESLGPLPPVSGNPMPPSQGPWVSGTGRQVRRWQMKANLSEYWPELCLSHLP